MALSFACEKRPVSGSEGVVVTNHPQASAAGMSILAAGGNAIDASVGGLFALTVVEPMMVGITGGGISHLHLATGEHLVVDALSCAPGSMTAESYTPASDRADDMTTQGRRSEVGPSAVAVPGNLAGWCEMHERHGSLPLDEVMAPAIRLARRGFKVSPYLAGAIKDAADDLSRDVAMAAVFLPSGKSLVAGDRLYQSDYATSLELIAEQGAAALYDGPLGQALVERINAAGNDAGWLRLEDLHAYQPVLRTPLTGHYRGFDIVGPPPPASSGIHVVQMLNMMEGFDVAKSGFGSVDNLHRLAETMRIAFVDRRQYSGDPAFVDVPVAHLMSKTYAETCRQQIRPMGKGNEVPPGPYESHDTTHVTVADKAGNVVSATHTLNGLFGARFMVPGTGMIPNNYMSNFDPHPGRALSIAPGKRVPTSMAPLFVLKNGKPRLALGLPGAVRIFPSAFQTILNVIDHGMSLQQAVEAPSLWTAGNQVELEPGFATRTEALARLGHDIKMVAHIGGGMNAIAFKDNGDIEGAACWRADGTPMAMGGGLARPEVRFEM